MARKINLKSFTQLWQTMSLLLLKSRSWIPKKLRFTSLQQRIRICSISRAQQICLIWIPCTQELSTTNPQCNLGRSSLTLIRRSLWSMIHFWRCRTFWEKVRAANIRGTTFCKCALASSMIPPFWEIQWWEMLMQVYMEALWSLKKACSQQLGKINKLLFKTNRLIIQTTMV